jgi:molybdopterin-binding protein
MRAAVSQCTTYKAQGVVCTLAGVELSARNQFRGRVTRLTRGGVVAEVIVDIGNGQEIVSIITNGSVERLNLREGSEVTAIVKATEVLLAG